MSAAKTIVIVDAFSSGNLYAAAFRQQGCRLVSLRSTPEFPSTFGASYRRDDFAAEIIHHGDLAATVVAVSAQKPFAVLAGSEPGVELAQAVNKALGLKCATNRQDDSHLRNKTKIYAALEAGRVPYGKFTQVASLDQLATFQRRLGDEAWPIVLKPARSSGTIDVFICKDQQEAEAAFQKIYQRPTAYEEINQSVLVQQYLDGVEYAVNLVSCDGSHRVTDVLRYARTERPGAATLYDYDLLLPFDAPEAAPLIDYAKQVLGALQIINGPTHLEIKLTTHGPRLVDFGARLCGAGIPRLIAMATGASQLDWTVQACLDPEGFKQRSEGYAIRQQLAVVFLNTDGGRYLTLRQLPQLRRIAGVVECDFYLKEGELLMPTINCNSTVGAVVLFASTSEQLQQSIAAIQAMQHQRAFETVEPPLSAPTMFQNA